MPSFGPYEGIVDIAMTLEGDLIIENGDVKLVNGIDWLAQEVNKIIRTNNPDWIMHPRVGAGLDDFAGLPNTRDVASQIQTRLHDKITEEGITYPGVLSVRVVPLTVDSIMCYITIEVEGQQLPVTKFIYDMSNGLPQVIEDSTQVEQPKQAQTNTEISTHPFIRRYK